MFQHESTCFVADGEIAVCGTDREQLRVASLAVFVGVNAPDRLLLRKESAARTVMIVIAGAKQRQVLEQAIKDGPLLPLPIDRLL
jgi:hypothetical protein